MPTIEEMLKEKLPVEFIKQREIAGGKKIDYLDGWVIIENANRIFGFDGWEYDPQHFECVNRETFTKKKKSQSDPDVIGYRVSYTCKGTVAIITKFLDKDGFSAEKRQVFGGVGYGSGVSYQDFGDATESAIKEADTDCMKRCFRFKGNQFGLALYDKEHRNVDISAQDKIHAFIAEQPENSREAYKESIRTFNKACKVTTVDDLSYAQCLELLNNLHELKNMQDKK